MKLRITLPEKRVGKGIYDREGVRGCGEGGKERGREVLSLTLHTPPLQCGGIRKQLNYGGLSSHEWNSHLTKEAPEFPCPFYHMWL